MWSLSATANSFAPPANPTPRSVVAAIGHFGNFELYARFGQFAPALPMRHHLPRPAPALPESPAPIFARAFRLPLFRAPLRRRRFAGLHAPAGRHPGPPRRPARRPRRPAPALPGTGLLHLGGAGRLRPPLPLRPAPGYLLSPRPGPLAHRGRPGNPHPRERPRPLPEDIMRDVNRAFEAAVRRDPANWFWVHNRWKIRGR